MIGYTIAVLFSIFFCILIWSFRIEWIAFFTDDRKIGAIMIDILPFFISGIWLLQSFMVVLTGLLKGINKANFVSCTTLVVYYVIGVPLILCLSEPWGMNLKLFGIWLENGVCNFLLVVIYSYKLFRIDWNA